MITWQQNLEYKASKLKVNENQIFKISFLDF